MPSIPARLFSAAIKLTVRRRDWGREEKLARRARRIFGVREELQPFYTRGLLIDRVRDGSIEGEWLRTRDHSAGAILYLHGGGYVSCSSGTHRPVTTRIAKLTHRPVFALDYRLAPENRFPAALDDAVACYLWLVEKLRIDPLSIAIGGDSAGGGLAISTMLKLREMGKALPGAGFCFSPWTDLSGSSTIAHENDGKCAMFRVDNIVDFANAYLGATPPTNPLASPLFGDLSGLPPILIHVGSTELLLDDSVRLHQRIQAAGGESAIEIFDDVPHAWQMLDGFVPEARRSLRQVTEFLNARLDRPAGG